MYSGDEGARLGLPQHLDAAPAAWYGVVERRPTVWLVIGGGEVAAGAGEERQALGRIWEMQEGP